MASQKELADEFHVSFRAQKIEIESRLRVAASPSSAHALNSLQVELSGLRKRLTDATAFLPPYDQRQLDIQVKGLEKALGEARAAAMPKAKFAFRRAKKPMEDSAPAEPAPAPASEVVSSPAVVDATPPPSSVQYTLADESNKCLTIASIGSPGNAHSTPVDLTISNLDSCLVNLVKNDDTTPIIIGSIHARDLKHTVLIAPLLSGSIMLHDCHHCVIIAGAHQFRIHTSSSIDIHLHAGSTPIIERCTALRVGPYLLPIPDGKGASASKHGEVQDFNWMRQGPSPNWTVMPQDVGEARKVWVHELLAVQIGELDERIVDVLRSL